MQDADIVLAEYCSDEEDNFTVKSVFIPALHAIMIGMGRVVSNIFCTLFFF